MAALGRNIDAFDDLADHLPVIDTAMGSAAEPNFAADLNP